MSVLRARLGELASPLAVPAYRRIWGAQALSEVGDYAARVALSMLVFSQTGSATWAALTLVLSLLPWVGPGQLLATVADRYGRRVVLVVCDLVRAAAYLLLCVPMPLPVLLTVTFVAGLAVPPFAAARSAAIPEVVDADTLGGAYRVAGVTQDLGIVLGALVGGLLIALVGPQGALALNAATFVASAVLLAGLPALRPTTGPVTGSGAVRRVGQAAVLLWRRRLLRRAVLLGNLAVAAGTAVETLVVPHAATEFPAVSWLAGGVLAAVSVAALLVTMAAPTEGDAVRLMRATAAVTLLPAGVAGVLLASGHPVAGVAGFVAAGGVFAALVPAQTVIAPRLPAHMRATAFAVLMGGLAALQAVLVAVAGVLGDLVGVQTAAAAVCAAAAAGAGWVLATPGHDREPDTDPAGGDGALSEAAGVLS